MTRARRTGVWIRSKWVKLDGPKSEVGMQSVQCARHEIEVEVEGPTDMMRIRGSKSNIKTEDYRVHKSSTYILVSNIG